MQISEWVSEPQHVGEQEAYHAHRSGSPPLPADNGDDGSPCFPSSSRARLNSVSLVGYAVAAILSIVLTAYFCFFSSPSLKSPGPVSRQLADGKDEEKCRQLFSGEESTSDAGPEESPLQSVDGGVQRTTTGRKRLISTDEGEDQAKKSRTEDMEEQSAASTAESQPSELEDRQTETGGADVTEESEWLDSLLMGTGELLTAPTLSIDQWFLDHILQRPSGPSSSKDAATPSGGVEPGPGRDGSPSEDTASEGPLDSGSGIPSATSGKLSPSERLPGSPEPRQFLSDQPRGDSAQEHPGSPSHSLQEEEYFPSGPSTSFAGLSESSDNAALEAGFLQALVRRTMQQRDAESREESFIPEELGLEGHPFYRLPRTSGSLLVAPFSWNRAIVYTPRKSPASPLLQAYSLLKKRSLTNDDAQTLVFIGEQLVRNIMSLPYSDSRELPGWWILIPLARRFLLVDCLWSICEVVGAPMRQFTWWQKLMRRTLATPLPKPSIRKSKPDRDQLARDLVAALEEFKSGRRPTAAQIVELKRQLFCRPDSPKYFKKPEWDPWREDDRNFPAT